MSDMVTAGHGTVIQLLEHFLAEVRANPKIGYGQVVLIEHGDRMPHGGYAGDVQLEAKAERAAMSAAGMIRDRIINRVLPARDASVPANYAIYNVPSGSLSYDFIIWLIDAEMQRIREDAPAPLNVHFWYGRDGKAGPSDLNRQMFENVVKPSLALVGAVEHPDAIHGRDYAQRHLRMVTELSRQGHKVPQLKAPVRVFNTMREWLGPKRPVTITLREATHWPHRNSDMEAWVKFAVYLQDRGERVIFVRDTDKADEPLGNFHTCPQASRDLYARMALYQQAQANLFVANGPCILAAFSDRPWLTFTQVEPDDSTYAANTPAFWRMHIGIDVGEQYPWSAPDQQIVWAPDTFENILTAWKDVMVRRPLTKVG